MENKNIIKSISFFLFVSCVFTCGTIKQNKISPSIQCDIEKNYFQECLNSTLVSSYSKRIYLGEVITINDSINIIIDSLFNGNSYYNQFYLLVITKAISVADGATGEALAFNCKKYVETSGAHFFCMVSGNKEHASTVTDKWAEIICSELILENENETKNAQKIFIEKIKSIKLSNGDQIKIQKDFISKVEFCSKH